MCNVLSTWEVGYMIKPEWLKSDQPCQETGTLVYFSSSAEREKNIWPKEAQEFDRANLRINHQKYGELGFMCK